MLIFCYCIRGEMSIRKFFNIGNIRKYDIAVNIAYNMRVTSQALITSYSLMWIFNTYGYSILSYY